MPAPAPPLPPPRPAAPRTRPDPSLSLSRLLDPEVLADPYPLYRRLREHDRVLWDPFLHAWVVTGYADVVTVLHRFSADRAPTPDQFAALGLGEMDGVARMMVRQMLFMDAPAHTRLRGLCAAAFTSRRVELLRERIEHVADTLLDRVAASGRMDVIADFAAPLPAIITAALLGVPAEDHEQLKAWSADFSEILGNFQHNPDRIARVLRSVGEMTRYFGAALRGGQQRSPCPGLIHSLATAEVEGARLTEEEIVANVVVTMVGGQETTTNLIGNGLLTLLRTPDQMARLRGAAAAGGGDPDLIESAVEELLRYESPSQHTARLAPDDLVLGGKQVRRRDAVIAVMAAGNRDPARFPDPDRLDLARADNRHLAFGWAAHFCFGAPLARMEGQVAFAALLRRLPNLALVPGAPLAWRENLGLRGLKALHVSFDAAPPRRRGEGAAG